MSFLETKKRNSIKTVTKEGGQGYVSTAKEELFSIVAGSLMSGDSFYEKQVDRLKRFREVVKNVLKEKDGVLFAASLAVYAREKMYMRTTPTILVAELFLNSVGLLAHAAADRVFVRGDEALEALAYVAHVKSKVPNQLKKAIQRSIKRMDEYKAVKYARGGKNVTLKGAIKITHPKPSDAKQSALFHYIRSGWEDLSKEEKDLLPKISEMRNGKALTWEQLISTKGSNSDTWSQAVDIMPYMATLRNLRNLVKNNVENSKLDKALEKISNSESVAYSMQFPYRFYAAWKELYDAPVKVKDAVVDALEHSCGNIPKLPGNNLVLVDVSGSMQSPVSNMSTIQMVELGAVLGTALAKSQKADIVAFGTNAKFVNYSTRDTIVSVTDKIRPMGNVVGHGTNIGGSLNWALSNSKVSYDRAFIFTDMQTRDDLQSIVDKYKKVNSNFEVYLINLSPYADKCLDTNQKGVIFLGGWSDNMLKWIGQRESGASINDVIEYAGLTSQ